MRIKDYASKGALTIDDLVDASNTAYTIGYGDGLTRKAHDFNAAYNRYVGCDVINIEPPTSCMAQAGVE